MRIYTRSGDLGQTRLANGHSVAKDDLALQVCGAIDELASFLGFATATTSNPELRRAIEEIQNDLFIIGTELTGANTALSITPAQVTSLERQIDDITAELPPLRQFILPGGSPTGAALHVARATARRAERALVSLARVQSVAPAMLAYCNRLSDFLFVLARKANLLDNVPECTWQRPD